VGPWQSTAQGGKKKHAKKNGKNKTFEKTEGHRGLGSAKIVNPVGRWGKRRGTQALAGWERGAETSGKPGGPRPKHHGKEMHTRKLSKGFAPPSN